MMLTLLAVAVLHLTHPAYAGLTMGAREMQASEMVALLAQGGGAQRLQLPSTPPKVDTYSLNNPHDVIQVIQSHPTKSQGKHLSIF